MVFNAAEVGERLRDLRIERGLTQEQVAKEINISRSLVSNIEYGNRLNINNIVSLCVLYGVSLDHIIPIKKKSKERNLDHMIKIELSRANLDTKETILKLLIALNK